MKIPHLIIGIVLISCGAVFLGIAITNPCQGALLSQEGCASATVQQFNTFFPLGALFLVVAVVVLFIGKTKTKASRPKAIDSQNKLDPA
jgi:hypothetical protein